MSNSFEAGFGKCIAAAKCDKINWWTNSDMERLLYMPLNDDAMKEKSTAYSPI